MTDDHRSLVPDGAPDYYHQTPPMDFIEELDATLQQTIDAAMAAAPPAYRRSVAWACAHSTDDTDDARLTEAVMKRMAGWHVPGTPVFDRPTFDETWPEAMRGDWWLVQRGGGLVRSELLMRLHATDRDTVRFDLDQFETDMQTHLAPFVDVIGRPHRYQRSHVVSGQVLELRRSRLLLKPVAISPRLGGATRHVYVEAHLAAYLEQAHLIRALPMRAKGTKDGNPVWAQAFAGFDEAGRAIALVFATNTTNASVRLLEDPAWGLLPGGAWGNAPLTSNAILYGEDSPAPVGEPDGVNVFAMFGPGSARVVIETTAMTDATPYGRWAIELQLPLDQAADLREACERTGCPPVDGWLPVPHHLVDWANLQKTDPHLWSTRA